MTQPEESFCNVLNQPQPYGWSGFLDNQNVVIQMEPRPLSPSGYPPAATNYGVPQLPISGIDKLDVLEQYGIYYLDYETEDTYVNVIGGNSPDSNNVIFKVQRVSRPSQGKSGNISNATMNFIDGNQRIVFSSDRTQFRSQVVCDDIALGQVSGDCCGCDRSFDVTSDTSNKKFELVPQGTCSGVGFSCCNYCLMKEYYIFDTTGNSARKVGSITCGDKIEIKLNSSGIDKSSKATLLAASLVVYELYFSPCCGNVGEMGSQCLCASCLTIFPILCLIIVVMVKLVFYPNTA